MTATTDTVARSRVKVGIVVQAAWLALLAQRTRSFQVAFQTRTAPQS